jgi:hypothetical protein
MVPLWFLLSLLCAISWSAADAFSKRALRDHSLQSVFWARWDSDARSRNLKSRKECLLT